MNTLKKMFLIGSCCTYFAWSTPTIVIAQNDHHLIPECPAMIAAVAPNTTVSQPLTFDAQVPKKNLEDQYSAHRTIKRHGNLASFHDLLSPQLNLSLQPTTTISQIDGLLSETIQLDLYVDASVKSGKKVNYQTEEKSATVSVPSPTSKQAIGTPHPIAQSQLIAALQETVKKANEAKALSEKGKTEKRPHQQEASKQSIANLDHVLMQASNTTASVAEQNKLPIGVIANSLTLAKKDPMLVNKASYVTYHYAVTSAQIAQTYDLNLQEVVTYNDLTNSAIIIPPQTPIYLGHKKSKGMEKFHTVQTNEKMWTIAQEHGIRLEKLYERNYMKMGQEPMAGEKIYLRGRADYPPKMVRKKRKKRTVNTSELDNLKYKYDRKDPGRMSNG